MNDEPDDEGLLAWAPDLARPHLALARFGSTCPVHGPVLVLFDDDPIVWACECPKGACKPGSAPQVSALVALGHGRELPAVAERMPSVSLPSAIAPTVLLANAAPAMAGTVEQAVVPRLLKVAAGLGVSEWLAVTSGGGGTVIALGLCLGVPTCIFAPFRGAPPIRRAA